MSIGLIVPDVHEKIVKLERIVDKYDSVVDWIVFLGDFLDSFDGLTEYTHLTAKWIVDNVYNPKYTFLFGNHDLHYAWQVPELRCSGFTFEKQQVVGRYIKREHWDRFQLLKWVGAGENEWLCSHAGLHPSLLDPVAGFDKRFLEDAEHRAIQRLDISEIDPLLAAGRGRGGPAPVGGVDWLDWDSEFAPVRGLHQIVGHTPGRDVRWKETPDSRNVCIDTDLNHVAIIEGNCLKIQEVF